MINDLTKNEGTRLQGFIEIEKVSTKDNVRKVYKNTITSGGKQLILDKSVAAMLSMSADIFGTVACSNQIMKNGVEGSNNYSFRNARSDRDITNVLLNLDETTLANLGVNTSFVNVWNTDMTEAEKVVGYANSNLNPTADGKEGTIDFCKGEYMVDPYTVCKRWKYPEGIATGTFNTIAMMPAGPLLDPSGDGVKFSKCIDKVNTQYQNYLSMSTGFLIPGVPGYTSNNEVLLNFSKDGVSKWKYNIGTGEVTQVPDTDPFFIPTVSSGDITDMQLIDNYLYVVSMPVHVNSQHVTVNVYDPSNSMDNVATITCRYKVTNEYRIKASIFNANDNIYVSAISSTDGEDSSGIGKLWKLTIGTSGYATSGTITALTDFSELGLTVPTGMNINTVGLGAYGENYVLYHTVKLYTNLSTSKTVVTPGYTGYKVVGYVFTDLADPAGTIVDMIPGINPNEVLFANSALKGTLRVGFDRHSTYATNNQPGGTYDLEHAKYNIVNNDNQTTTTTVTINTMQTGVYLTLDKWWTNIISFVKLTTPIEKTDSDIIYISYGYKIV